MPKPYRQYVPPKIAPGTIVKNWRVISFSRRITYPDSRGVPMRSNRWYLVECTNCGIRLEKQTGNMNMGGCHACYLMPAGQSGCNRIFGNYRRVSRRQKRSFSLTAEQFRSFTSSPCFYCGSPPLSVMGCNMQNTKRSTWGDYTYNGIDRIDNSIGYTVENCVTCCHFCNRAKNDRSFQEFASHMRGVMARIKAGNLPEVSVSLL